MNTTKTMLLAAAALALLLLEPALADEMDLTISVRTARPTTVSPMKYRLDAGAARALGDAEAGDDGTTPVPLTIHVDTPVAATLHTSLGQFSLSIGEDGTISASAGSLLSVVGTGIAIQNDLDLDDFGVRMRRTSTVKAVGLTPGAYRDGVYPSVNTGIVPGAAELSGAEATTALRWPLRGVIPGTRVRIANTLGPIFYATVSAAGGLAIAPDPDGLPISIDAADPQVLIIENTVDLPDFAMRMAKPTTAVRVWYWVQTSWEYFAHYPGPPELPVHPFDYGLTYYPGPVAHVDSVAFPLIGLAPNQTILIRSVYGGEAYRVVADGTLVQTSTNSRLVWDGDVAVVQNLLDIPGFRIRLADPVNAQLVRMAFSIYSTPGSAISMSDVELPAIGGEEADQGIALPLLGIVPGVVFQATTPIAGLHVVATAEGGLEVVNPVSPPRGRIVEIDGGPQLVIDNPISVRCRVYGEDPIPWLGTDGILASIEFTWAPSPIDPADEGHYIYRACDGAEWPTGVQFVLQNVGPYTGLRSPTGFGLTHWITGITFRVNHDGTATFLAPARTLTPWKGAIDIDVNRDGVNDNVYYLEIAPLNTAPTATFSTGNFSIPTSAQSSTVVSAVVDDADGGDLTCRWYVDGALVHEEVVAAGGTTALELGTLAPLGVGAHTIRLEASDGELAAMPEIVMTLENSPPEVVAGGGGVYELGPDSVVSLTGTAADFDGDELSYEWCRGDGTVIATGTITTVAGGEPVGGLDLAVPTAVLGLGMHLLTLVVEDEDNPPVEATTVVEVKDTTGPTLAPTASHRLLWPPNHQMVDVTVMANAWDASDGSLTYDVTIESSEPPEFDGSGNFEPDHDVVSIDPATGEIHVLLRAERSGQGDGRVYTILVTATDASGNASTASFEVKAPHDKGKK